MASNAYRDRLRQFDAILTNNSDQIDVQKLRSLIFEGGCPDGISNYRSLSWKILLGYLSPNRDEWETTLTEKRAVYKSFVDELILNDATKSNQHDDHPLNPAPTSQWNVYFKDNEVLSQIFKDVRRLYPDISFFQQKVPKKFAQQQPEIDNGDTTSQKTPRDIIGRSSLMRPKSIDIVRSTFGATLSKSSSNGGKNGSFDDECDNFDELLTDDDDKEYNWQIVARLLFIYAKLNPGQGYVQGMNEIIGPLYYVFTNDCDPEWNEHSEADTFWCFTELMSEIRDMYNSQLDADRRTGVVSMMTKLSNCLSKIDMDLYVQLYNAQNIKPHYYAFRWLTLLLSQEFPLPDVLRIWDFLFADQSRFDFLITTCCAMLLVLRDQLMAGDFATNMKLLQNFPYDRIDVRTVIQKAKQLS